MKRRSQQATRTVSLRLLMATILVVALGVASPAVSRASGAHPIRHIWLIDLENKTYNTNFGHVDPANPYQGRVIPALGTVVDSYYGIGHNSLDNYIAQVSGQAPTPDTQGDCLVPADWFPTDPTVDANGQVVGQGCVYPQEAKTIADQLQARGMTWKGYEEDMGRDLMSDRRTNCSTAGNPNSVDGYIAKHNPFVWFHSIRDDLANCQAHDVPLTELAPDLQRIDSTPNFSFITPGMADDDHDVPSGVLRLSDGWLHHYLPLIMSSPAFRQDGLIVVTYDEAFNGFGGFVGLPEAQSSCCGEIPGPNSPKPGVTGQGGGQVGAAFISPYVKPGVTTTAHDYNHYSALRSYEDLFGITTGGADGHGHLGFAAGNGGPNDTPAYAFRPFGCDDIFTIVCPPAASDVPAPDEPKDGPDVGPRPDDGSARWLNPAPGGNDLNGVSCSTGSHCVAVGAAGAAVSTADGTTWTSRRSGTRTDLNGVSCPPNAGSCVAVGANGAVLRTGDGGQSWSAASSGTRHDLTDVSCPSTSRCYAVGAAGTIIVSDDGGASWAAQSSPTTVDLAQVDCPGQTTCYVSGDIRFTPSSIPNTAPTPTPSIVSTTDGGETWARHDATTPQAGRLQGIGCVDAARCTAGSERADFAYTKDGGSWAAASDPKYSSVNPGRVRAISCLASGACAAVGERGISGTSKDGGQTWDVAGDEGFRDLNDVSCPSATACYAVGQDGAILQSGDQGGTWTARSANVAASNLQATVSNAFGSGSGGEAIGAVDLAGVSCSSSSSCVAVGKQGAILVSGDGGSSWRARGGALRLAPAKPAGGGPFPPPPIPVSTDATGLLAVTCPSRASCVAVGDPLVDDPPKVQARISTTADGGETWTSRASNTPNALSGVSCPSVTVCFAVGDYGTVLKSGDGGSSWTAQESGTKSFLNAVSCPDPSTCVVVGSLGTVLRTTDGGAHWGSEDSQTSSYLAAVSCPSTNLCIGVGSGGTVLRITGSGTPSAKSSGVDDDLMGVSCASHTDCVATGGFGSLVSTANGGNGWTVQGTGTGRALRGVACPSTGTCIAAGDAGAVLGVTPTAKPGNGPPSPEGEPGPNSLRDLLGLPCQAQVLRSQILSRGLRLSSRLVRVSGSSRTRQCREDRVTRVRVAVAKAAPHGRCQFLGRGGRLGRPVTCRRPVYQFARVRYVPQRQLTTWTFSRRVGLRPGRYRVLVRGQDRFGLLEAGWASRARSLGRR